MIVCDVNINYGRMRYAPTRVCYYAFRNMLCLGKACCAPTRDRPHVTPGSLGAIIRSFKSAVTKAVQEQLDSPHLIIWQRNYYEHVIRNEADMTEKRKYIIDNPAKWDDDEYYLNKPATGEFSK